MLISIETRHRKKSTCRYERNRIMKINFKKMHAAVSSMWKLMQIAQMDVIRFARRRELGLLRISSHVNIRIRPLNQHCKNFDQFF